MSKDFNFPLVSVGIPAFKASFLHEALISWVGQSFQDFECIVIDDASPEDLASIVTPFLADARFSYFRFEKNSAPNFAQNWNRCLEKAKGKYFVLASDDDIYGRDFLTKMVALAELYPSQNLFMSGWTMYTPGKEENPAPLRHAIESQIQFLYHRYYQDMRIVAPIALMRINALREIGGFADLPAAWFSDDLTFARLAKNGVRFCPDLLVKFRMQGQNVTMSVNERWLEYKIKATEDYSKALQALFQNVEVNDETVTCGDNLRLLWLRHNMELWLKQHAQVIALLLPVRKAYKYYFRDGFRVGGRWFVRALCTRGCYNVRRLLKRF